MVFIVIQETSSFAFEVSTCSGRMVLLSRAVRGGDDAMIFQIVVGIENGRNVSIECFFSCCVEYSNLSENCTKPNLETGTIDSGVEAELWVSRLS